MHDQEAATNAPPNRNIIHLFRHTPENQEQRYAAITRGFGMARRVTNDALQEIRQIEENMEDFRSQFTQRLQDQMERLASLRISLQAQHTVVQAAEEAMTAEETPSATALFNNTPDQEDIDHVMY